MDNADFIVDANNADGVKTFATVQEAVDAAEGRERTTILLRAGVHDALTVSSKAGALNIVGEEGVHISNSLFTSEP